MIKMASQENILIIDPFKNLLHVYRMILERERYRVETASHLTEAAQKLHKENYAVLISELMPPFEKTFQMLQGVKEQSRETYIIIVTNAMIDEKTYEKLFDIGVDDLILKPYSPRKILTHVKKGFRYRNMMIHKKELERTSLTDPIALKIHHPIYNATHFGRCLREELKRSKRHQHLFSLLLLKITAGRIAKDQLENVMIELIKTLRSHIREEDTVGRTNGRFGILLPETDEAGSQAVVDRLRHLIPTDPSVQSEEGRRSIDNFISFQSFTYPEKFLIPGPLSSIMEGISKPYPHP